MSQQQTTTSAREVKLDYSRSTPGTHVYATAEKGVICKQVYLSREALPHAPASITLLVTWEN